MIHQGSELLQVERRLAGGVDLESRRIRESFAMIPVLIAQLEGLSLTFVLANDAYLRMAGRSRSDVIGRSYGTVFPELERQGFGDIMRRVINTGEIFVAKDCERIISRHGRMESVYIDFIYLPVRNSAGAVQGVLFQGTEVTEQLHVRKALESRVRQATAELEQAQGMLHALNQKGLDVQEAEQRRIALELHDSTGQLVTALRWKLGTLQLEIGSDNTEQSKLVKAAIGLLNELSSELRTVSHLLHPPNLAEGGLPSALRIYVDGLAERSGLKIDLQVDQSMVKLPTQVERAVFRIIQECLTNVHRHAKSKFARVRLYRSGGRIQLSIKDRGHGIPGFKSVREPTFRLGVGIRGMQERVRQLNGSFQMESSASGTTVRVALPDRVRSMKTNEDPKLGMPYAG
jgi:PAS domain S-box-containing protein